MGSKKGQTEQVADWVEPSALSAYHQDYHN
jgi:hypothetical protein